jgi:hypothetical protein
MGVNYTMPYKNRKRQLEYYRNYGKKRTLLIREGKKALGIPLDKRRKKLKKEKLSPE